MAANGACDGKTMVSMYESKQIADYIRNHPTYSRIVIALSGDVGFYSGAKKLQAVLAEDADFSVRVDHGITTLIYFYSKIGVSWEDAAFVSLHGQHCNFLETVRRNRKTLAIAGGKGSVREICQTLSSYGWEQIVLYVGTDLSYPEEQIVTGSPFELANMEFAPLAVLLFENPNPEPEFTAGMADEVFLRDKVPMTKREVRNASLSHLQLSSNSVVYDFGSGTGSVSIEMALRAAQGKVYAIEKNPAAVALLQENKKKFAVDHLEIIEGTAPEALEALPVPTHAFIGGSAGNASATRPTPGRTVPTPDTARPSSGPFPDPALPPERPKAGNRAANLQKRREFSIFRIRKDQSHYTYFYYEKNLPADRRHFGGTLRRGAMAARRRPHQNRLGRESRPAERPARIPAPAVGPRRVAEPQRPVELRDPSAGRNARRIRRRDSRAVRRGVGALGRGPVPRRRERPLVRTDLLCSGDMARQRGAAALRRR